ncbi:unnamed protein product [Caenorhabditis sp. 36 PRJEB53466]|nr:unnamed protein product [Caenorhabditis sp. 36 PRJEB53466]
MSSTTELPLITQIALFERKCDSTYSWLAENLKYSVQLVYLLPAACLHARILWILCWKYRTFYMKHSFYVLFFIDCLVCFILVLMDICFARVFQYFPQFCEPMSNFVKTTPVFAAIYYPLQQHLHCAQPVVQVLLTLNRMSCVLLPLKYSQIWTDSMKYAIALVIFAPFLFIWNVIISKKVPIYTFGGFYVGYERVVLWATMSLFLLILRATTIAITAFSTLITVFRMSQLSKRLISSERTLCIASFLISACFLGTAAAEGMLLVISSIFVSRPLMYTPQFCQFFTDFLASHSILLDVYYPILRHLQAVQILLQMLLIANRATCVLIPTNYTIFWRARRLRAILVFSALLPVLCTWNIVISAKVVRHAYGGLFVSYNRWANWARASLFFAILRAISMIFIAVATFLTVFKMSRMKKRAVASEHRLCWASVLMSVCFLVPALAEFRYYQNRDSLNGSNWEYGLLLVSWDVQDIGVSMSCNVNYTPLVENFKFFLQTVYLLPIAVLYSRILYVIWWKHQSVYSRHQFFVIYSLDGVVGLLLVLLDILITRLFVYIPQLCESGSQFFQSHPLIMDFYYPLLNYLHCAQPFIQIFLTTNRMSSVLFPVDHNKLWSAKLPLILIFIVFSPFAFIWNTIISQKVIVYYFGGFFMIGLKKVAWADVSLFLFVIRSVAVGITALAVFNKEYGSSWINFLIQPFAWDVLNCG